MGISAIQISGAYKNTPTSKARLITSGLSGGDGPLSSLKSKSCPKAGLSGGDGPLSNIPSSIEKVWSQKILNGLSGGDGPLSSLESRTNTKAGLSGGDGPLSSLKKHAVSSAWFRARQNIQNGIVNNPRELIEKNPDARNPVA